MLQFFRRYQKFFFSIVAFFVIFSFAFFGAFSTFFKGQSVPEKKIGKTVDGTFITDLQVLALAHFLNAGQDCLASLQPGSGVVLFNDGVLLKDFIETGFALQLFDRFEDSFKEEIQEKISHAKHFRPYAHPYAPALNQESVWRSFHPELFNHVKQLQALADSDVRGGFVLLMKLFKDQQALPSAAVQRVLMYQASQYRGGVKDSDIRSRDFALFGFHTAQDWFGKSFITAVARTILNGSSLAKQEGISIDTKEVRQQLLTNLSTAYKKFGEGEEVAPLRLKKTYQDQIRSLGLEEGKVLDIWRTVSLFRQYLKKDTDKLFVDAMAEEAFTAFAQDSVEVELYELPDVLQLRTFQEVAELEVYLEAIAAKKDKRFSLLGPYASIEEITKRSPELIFQTFEVEWSEVDKDALSIKIPLKEILSWQLEPMNWQTMKEKFPYLIDKELSTEEDRFSFLETLEDKARDKLDAFTKAQIVDAHPEWMEEALENEKLKTQTLYLSQGGKTPFVGVKDPEELISVLQRSREPLTHTFDGKHYYRCTLLSPPSAKAVMPFSLAKEQKVLNQLLEKKIAQHYPEMRKKSPERFKKKDGSWKAVHEVHQEAYRYLFPSLIEELISKAQSMENMPHLDVDTFPLDLLAKYRLIEYVEKVRTGAIQASDISLWDESWRMRKSPKILKRSSSLSQGSKELFEENEGFVSALKMLPHSGLGFFEVKGKPNLEKGIISAEPMRRLIAEELEEKQFKALLGKLSEEHIFQEAL